MKFLPGQFSLAVLSHSLSKRQHAKGSLLSSLMSSLHRRDGLPPSPSPTLERLAFLQNSTGFSSNICHLGNELTLRKLWTFEDHLTTVRNLSSPLFLLPPHCLPEPKRSRAATWHLPVSFSLINYKPICVYDFLICFDFSLNCDSSWNLKAVTVLECRQRADAFV